jgi:hypothetical protein
MRLAPSASVMFGSRRTSRSNGWRLHAHDCENTLGRIAPRKAPALWVLLCSSALCSFLGLDVFSFRLRCWGAIIPTRPSPLMGPIEGEGSPCASDLPRKIVTVIERRHTSVGDHGEDGL